MSFIFWSDVTFIYTMYCIIIYVICQIGNYLVDIYLFPRFYVRSIVFIINAAFLYINWARLIVLYPVIYYLLKIKEPSYISQTLFWGLTNKTTTYHTVQVCAGISQHFPFVTHSDDYGTFTVIHHLDGGELAAFISVKAPITKFVIWGKGKQFQHAYILSKIGKQFYTMLRV